MSKKIAVINGGGGTGKTHVSVGLACHWSDRGHTVVVVDTDPMDRKSAKRWLEKFPDNEAPIGDLLFIETSTSQLAESLQQIRLDDSVMIIDTPPQLHDSTIADIASQVDLVLVPGSPWGEVEVTTQTAATLVELTSTPVMVILNEVAKQQRGRAKAVADSLQTNIGVDIASTYLRRYQVADESRTYGDRPTNLPGLEGRRARKDLAALATDVEGKLGGL